MALQRNMRPNARRKRPRTFSGALLTAALVLISACTPIQPDSAPPATQRSTVPPAVLATATPLTSITATVLVNSLNLRAGPATEHGWLGNVRQRNVLTIAGMVDDCAWLLATRADGVSGWIAGEPRLVRTSVPCREIPEIADALVPTPPPTATPTRTATATRPPTATVTAAATETPAPAETSALTVTVDGTPTVTSTVSADTPSTPTPIASATVALTIAATETITAETITASETITSQETITPTDAITATATAVPTPTATFAPTPTATPSVATTGAPPVDAPDATPQPEAVEIPEGMGCVQIGNYVGPELTISFTNLSTGDGYTDTVAPNEEKLFCLEPALYTVTADAPPPFDTVDFEIEIVEGEGVHVPLIAR
jgi:hypothetical protein